MRRINLSTRKQAAVSGPPVVAGLAAAVLLLLLLAGLAGHWYFLRRQHDAAQENVRRLQRALSAREQETEMVQRLKRQSRELEEQRRELEGRIAVVDRLRDKRRDWHAVVSEISRLVPAGVWLTEIASRGGGSGSPAPEGGEAPAVVIHGRAVDSAALVSLLKNLQAGAGLLTAVDFSEMTRVPADAATGIPAHFAFEITCELAAGEPAAAGTGEAAAAADPDVAKE
jgi:Tfp pilus assembly protein PilN